MLQSIAPLGNDWGMALNKVIEHGYIQNVYTIAKIKQDIASSPKIMTKVKPSKLKVLLIFCQIMYIRRLHQRSKESPK
jgi:hypothetical protein